MINRRRIRTLIVGCGNIGGRFDQVDRNSSFTKSHAGAYTADGRYEIVACVDSDEKYRKEFMQYWGVGKGFYSLQQAVSELNDIDVVSICSPTELHRQHVEEAVGLSPKLIFCEKPLSGSVESTKSLFDLCKKNEVQLLVNYNRRWDKVLVELGEDICRGKHGILRSVVAVYNKGILNNGSHMLDLLVGLLGELDIISVLSSRLDYKVTDPSVSTYLESKDGVDVHLVSGSAEDYALFEVEFIFSEKILRMKDGGVSWSSRLVRDSEEFGGYRALGHELAMQGGYQNTFQFAVEEIHNVVLGSARVEKYVEQTLYVQSLCEALRDKVLAI